MAQITISPGTSDLGTITSDIQYTVTSDTTGTLTASIVVNGAQFAQQSLSSGVSSTISVMQLPTGSGIIILTATLVESVGATTTQSVTWTYTKTPINFSNSGSVASLAINGENILPTTLAEAVRTSPVWGGSLDLALQKLSNAAFYKSITSTAQLGTLAEGTIIYLNENGQPVPFYVAKQGYEPDYNTDRVLVVRKDIYSNTVWDAGQVNAYATSDIDTWFNSTYKNMLDADIRSLIGSTKIRYTPGNGNWTVGTLERAIFALSLTELGQSNTYANTEGSTLPIASTLEVAHLNGSVTIQWTRSPYTAATATAWVLNSDGNSGIGNCSNSHGSRPAFTLPSTFIVTTGDQTTGLYDISNNLLLTLPGVQIETGSYVGTGTYGASNPNSLTFGFAPKVLKLSIREESNQTYKEKIFSPFIFPSTISNVNDYSSSSGSTTGITISWEGNTVKWYSTNSIVQGNSATAIIDYYAIG